MATTTSTADGDQSQEHAQVDSPNTDLASDQVVLYDGISSWSTSILIKSLYFLDALGSSTWGRFSAVYYNIHHISESRIGVIECLRTSVPTISMVVWGIVADKYDCRKQVWLTTKTVSTMVLLVLAVPWIYNSFIRILIVSVGAQLFVSNGILDAFTLQELGPSQSQHYGKYRLYASLSWGIGSIIMGAFVDYWSFEWLFLMFGILAVAMIVLVAIFIPGRQSSNAAATDDDDDDDANYTHLDEQGIGQLRQPLLLNPDEIDPGLGPGPVGLDPVPEEDDDNDDTSGDTGKVSDLVKLAFCTSPRITWFLVEVVVMGAGMATVERLLFLYMVNDLDSSTLLCGLSVGVNVLFELPIFWYGDWLLEKFHHDVVYIVAMTFFVVRVYGYTLLEPSTKWWILPLEMMHGVTFACFWLVTLDIASILVHKTPGGKFWTTAIPSSIQMLYSAVGVSIGVAIGGYTMQYYGSRTMYRCTAFIVCCMLIIHIIGTILCRCRHRGRGRTMNDSPNSFLPVFEEERDGHASGGHSGDDRHNHNGTSSTQYRRLCGDDEDQGDGDVVTSDDNYDNWGAAFSIIENGALLSTDD